MKLYFRLLSYLKPHLKYLIPAMIFMLLFAGMSGFSITMVVPLTKIIFSSQEMITQDNPSAQQTSQGEEKGLLVLLPKILKEKFNQLIIGRTRLETLGRFCIFVFLIFLVKNLANHLTRPFGSSHD